MAREAFRKLRTQLNQYGANTGRPISDRAVKSMLEAELSADYNMSLQREQVAIQRRDAQLREQAAKDQAQASTISGVAQTAASAAQIYMLRNQLKGTTNPVPMAPKPVSPTLPPAAIPPGVSESGVIYGGNSAAFDATTGEFTEGYLAEGATSTGSVPYVPAAAAVYAGYRGWEGMQDAQKGTGGGPGSKAAIKLTPWNDAGTTGKVMNVVAAPLTALAGAVDIGAKILDDWFGLESIICQELYRQKYITKTELTKVRLYRDKFIGKDKYEDYLRWAAPVVRIMQKSKIATVIMLPVWKAWVKAMIAEVDKNAESSWFDRFVLRCTHKYTEYRLRRNNG